MACKTDDVADTPPSDPLTAAVCASDALVRETLDAAVAASDFDLAYAVSFAGDLLIARVVHRLSEQNGLLDGLVLYPRSLRDQAGPCRPLEDATARGSLGGVVGVDVRGVVHLA